ncbi:cyclin-dependent kinase inhibitor 3-like [Saccostrea echinata]|uniref:cyclin-dependent kinase inhibitor 3-like n=1 Tax=Saccostrea echinata TaxID=191078 RepID=UPI002A802FA5|nr:cyclin-dependent kinase inhibitor 3-like [Saccostrea echinata]
MKVETAISMSEELSTAATEQGFDSSDDDSGEVDLSPLDISWLDLTCYGFESPVGITSLPGCRFKDVWRSLENDIKYLVSEEVQDVYCLCSKGELTKYRVQWLLHELSGAGLTVHHFPFPDGQPPTTAQLMKIIEELKISLNNKRKAIIHCYGGLGRSCVVGACFLLSLDSEITPEKAIEKMKELRGPRAVQTVKQFNYINEFPQTLADFQKESEDVEIKGRSLSR